MSQCEPGYFANIATGTCDKCNDMCYECHGPHTDMCLSCHGLSYLSSGTWTTSCRDRMYPDQDKHVCQECHSTCATCHGPGGHNCSTCPAQSLHKDGMCVTCPPGRYLNSGTHSCDKCHESCYTCSGPEEDACLTCQPHMSLDPHSSTCSVYDPDSHNLSTFLVIVLWLLGKFHFLATS